MKQTIDIFYDNQSVGMDTKRILGVHLLRKRGNVCTCITTNVGTFITILGSSFMETTDKKRFLSGT